MYVIPVLTVSKSHLHYWFMIVKFKKQLDIGEATGKSQLFIFNLVK